MSLSGVQTLPLTVQNLCALPVSTMGLQSRIMSWLGECLKVTATPTLQTNTEKSSKLLEIPQPRPAYSKELCPDSYLDFAAKLDNNALASKEGIALTSVTNAIEDAAHYVAARERKPVMSVYSDFEGDRMRNGVHRTHKEYVAALNRRANTQFRASGIKKPDMSRMSAPCKVQKVGSKARCRRHAFCTLMQLEDAAKARYEAEQEATLSNIPAEVPQEHAADDVPRPLWMLDVALRK